MVHPDEGTIHAWLDGALAPDEALTVDAHVRTCEQCGQAIAEARGFIAASSRILSSLDDVPGQVIPGEVHAQPAVAHIRRADEQRKRRFRQNFALAATLLLMVSGGMFVVNQTSRTVASMADTAGLGARIAEVAGGDSAIPNTFADSVALPAVAVNTPAMTESQLAATSSDSSASQRAVNQAVGSVGAQVPITGSGAASTRSTADAASAPATKAVTPAPRQDHAATVASAPPPVPVTPPAVASASDVRSGAVGNVAGNAAGAAAAPQVAQREARMIDSIAVLSGCYQLASQVDLSIADSRRDEAMIVSALPARIRLTDTLVVNRNGDRRYLARSIMPGGTPVRRFAWSATGGSIRLFVGDSAGAPAVRAVTDSSATTTAPARLRRVGCGG